MPTNARKLCCGGCGEGTFEIYKYDGGLIAKCQKCRSTSTLTVPQPEIKIGWGENSEGILADF